VKDEKLAGGPVRPKLSGVFPSNSHVEGFQGVPGRPKLPPPPRNLPGESQKKGWHVFPIKQKQYDKIMYIGAKFCAPVIFFLVFVVGLPCEFPNWHLQKNKELTRVMIIAPLI